MKKMVDTIKLLIPMHDPLVLKKGAFAPISVEQLVNTHSNSRTYLNPSPIYKKTGRYMPKLTLHRRPTKVGISYQLAIEFSAPKMLFGNNFDELTENDFEPLLKDLQSKLHELTGHRFFEQQLRKADIGAWHPSKNIVFLNHIACQTVLNTIGKLDVSRIYDLQKTDFRDGSVVHIHCNSLEIAFYDKFYDLKQAKRSEKRAFEKDNAIQLNLLEELESHKPIEVLRYEVRLVGKPSVKRAYPDIEKPTLETLFKKELCQGVLLKHWHAISGSVDMLALDTNKPYELLQNYVEDNNGTTPQAALAAIGAQMVISQSGFQDFRNTLEARFGNHAWYRIKPLLSPPKAHRFSYFQHIDEHLERFNPTYISNYLSNIENTVR